MPNTPTNTDKIIDSRDVVARIDELESLIPEDGEPVSEEYPGLDEDETKELAALKALAAEGEADAEDWQYGAILIRESYFAEYFKEDYLELHHEMVARIKEGDKDLLDYIDWEGLADYYRPDYSEVTFAGVTYLAR